jgi:hypothetical protein
LTTLQNSSKSYCRWYDNTHGEFNVFMFESAVNNPIDALTKLNGC